MIALTVGTWHDHVVSALKDILRPYVVTGRRLARRELRLSDIGYSRQVSYSWCGEDIWLAEYFGEQTDGFYVDVGAFDPFNVSNTLLLCRRGWSGINIEPDPAALARFERFRPRDINLGVAVGENVGEAPFVLNGSFSGLEGPSHLWGMSDGAKRITVRTRPLRDILAEHCPDKEIEFLDVDCEGGELEVLRSSDWAKYRPRVVLVEIHPGGSEEPAEFLAKVGYRQAAVLGLTRVFDRD